MILLRELPKVVPYPRSRGSTTNRPYFLSSEISAIIKGDNDIEVLNPETVIATMNGGMDNKLFIEMTIKKGRGYSSSDKNKSDDQPIGTIAVDSIFTLSPRFNDKPSSFNFASTSSRDFRPRLRTFIISSCESSTQRPEWQEGKRSGGRQEA